MKRSRKIVALILFASMSLGIISCGKKEETADDEDVVTEEDLGDYIEFAEELGENIVQCDYDNIRPMCTDENEELREGMCFDSAVTDIDVAARQAVASTLTFSVDEDSAQITSDGESVQIDIDFEYVDYQSVIAEHGSFDSIDEFADCLSSCTNVIQETVTFELTCDDDILCENIEDALVLFPYFEVAFENVILDTLGYNTYMTIEGYCGDAYNEQLNRYTDTETIAYEINLSDAGQQFTWTYSYELYCGYDLVYSSDEITVEEPESLYIEYSLDGEYIPEGTYHFVIYMPDRYRYTIYDVDVYQNDPDQPMVTDLEYTCPDEDSTILPGTDIEITLPEDLSWRSSDDAGAQSCMSNSGSCQLIMYAEGEGNHPVTIEVYFLPGTGFESEEAESTVTLMVDKEEEEYGSYGDGLATCYSGENVYACWYVMPLDQGMEGCDSMYILMGNSNVCYIVRVSGTDVDTIFEMVEDW